MKPLRAIYEENLCFFVGAVYEVGLPFFGCILFIEVDLQLN